MGDDVDYEDQACPQPFDEWTLTPPHLPSILDPPKCHGAQLHEFLHTKKEEILDSLFLQFQRMMRHLGEQWTLNLDPEHKVSSEGLSLLMMMGFKLVWITEVSRDPTHDPK